jgi:hypothetical protein
MLHNLVPLIGWLEKNTFVWKNISKNPNDATCHIYKLLIVNILMCIVVASVIANVVAELIHGYI